MKKNRKNWWFADLVLQIDGKGALRVGAQLLFTSQRLYGLSVAVWWQIPVRIRVEFFYQKGWYKQKLQSVEMYQLVAKAAKMVTK